MNQKNFLQEVALGADSLIVATYLLYYYLDKHLLK